MGLTEAIAHLVREKPLQTRSIDSFTEYPGLTEQLLAIQGQSSTSWHAPSLKEALAVPAVFRAVTLIANTVGSLTLQAWRNGQKMDTAPVLVSRPGVFTNTRDFFRDTAYCLATRGEYIHWIVDRDDEGFARKLLILPPGEVTVQWNQRFPLVREYVWRNKNLSTDDVVHQTFAREPGALRGIGPLQMCGAALSVAVEADEWAARFFARGGAPSTVLTSPQNMTPKEAEDLVNQWLLREGNEVRVAAGGLKPEPFQVNPENAQLLESRTHSAANVATMFGMDSDLLNAAVSGSSLTYQNVGQRFDAFIRTCLSPGYLEPIEHAFSELLTRTTVARFDTQTLSRADIKTQAEVYKTLVDAAMPAAEAARIAGIDSLVDTVPVPAEIPSLTVQVPSA